MAEVYPGQFVGYYEMEDFHTNYFDDTANQHNIDAFANVKLYNDEA